MTNDATMTIHCVIHRQVVIHISLEMVHADTCTSRGRAAGHARAFVGAPGGVRPGVDQCRAAGEITARWLIVELIGAVASGTQTLIGVLQPSS